MAIRKIASIGHPILREPARRLSREELLSSPVQALIDDLVDTMRDAAGAGLAATQIYEPLQIAAVEVKDNPRYPYKPNYPLTVVVNPVVEPLTTETFDNYEGCLSVPNLRGQVPRFGHVRVRGWSRRGEDLDFEVKGFAAGVFQHEIDHLFGKLFVDRVVDTATLATLVEFERHVLPGYIERARAIAARWSG